MKIVAGLIPLIMLFAAFDTGSSATQQRQLVPITGSWKLLSGTVINKGDTTVTDYTHDKSVIKIINETHFAFLLHDLQNGKDSATATFVSGGGKYTLTESLYTEHLEFGVTAHPRAMTLHLIFRKRMIHLFKVVLKKMKQPL